MAPLWPVLVAALAGAPPPAPAPGPGCEAPPVLALGADLDFALELARGRRDREGRLVVELLAPRRWLPAGYALKARVCVSASGAPPVGAELDVPPDGSAELTVAVPGVPADAPLRVLARAFAVDPAVPSVALSDDTPEDDEAELVVGEVAGHSTSRDLALAADEGRVLVAGLAEAAERTDSVPATPAGTWTLPALRLAAVEPTVAPPTLDYETGEVVLAVLIRAEGRPLDRIDYRVEQTARTVQPLLSGTLAAADATRASTGVQEWGRRLAWKVGPEECGHPVAGEVWAQGSWAAPDGATYSTAPVRRAFTVKVPEETCAPPAEDEN